MLLHVILHNKEEKSTEIIAEQEKLNVKIV